ncbi:FAD-binding domain-containing protein [Mycena pura]|uniref:FAD-binding domain-containing protein n=1 Tax=Mycena pura TaxID=153505 RepID=A0AAD6Y5D9_9AGAR|nr:FAD-binding domain-containing protein [Mycena pura]
MKSFSFTTSLLLLLCVSLGHTSEAQQDSKSGRCHNTPGSAGYPSAAAWDAFNSSISGHLVDVVPSAKFCKSLPGGACTDAQWNSGVFRSTIPGAMDEVRRGYDLSPPSLCLRNGTTCGQGDVPIYSVEAETTADVQAAVKFASKHNLRLVVKSSGHDYLGRSTAPDSLLIRTSNFQNVSLTDAFFIGKKNMGSAVTFGSGLHANMLYQHTKANGKTVVAALAGTVSPAGGYLQGAGHSPLSPAFGLAADNALEYNVVVASGELLQVNSDSHPDLFFALRGGGAGSWGVIVSATVRTFPTFNATSSMIVLTAPNNTIASELATLHAQHIFDWDSVHAGHFFFFLKDSASATNPNAPTSLTLLMLMPHTTANRSTALLAPFLNASLAMPGVAVVSQAVESGDINDALFQADDGVGGNAAIGSRLIPQGTYRDSPEKAGAVYKKLLDGGTTSILAHIVAGGKVSENARIDSAVHPAWRTAKAHIIVSNAWDDSASLAEIHTLRKRFQTTQLPVLEELSGPNAGSYSNEADIEPHFQTTFFGPNYAKLSQIKRMHDPNDLFIVAAGVGSERWDEWGICRI